MATGDLNSVAAPAPQPMAPAPEQFDPGSILRALSQGPTAQAQANPMMGLAAGLSGAGAGWRGQQNPVVADVNQQEESNRRTQLANATILNEIAQRRQEAQNQQQRLGVDLLRMPSPGARQMGAQVLTNHLKTSGVQLPPGFEADLASGALTPDQRKEAYLAVRANPMVSDDYLVKQLNVPPAMVQNIRVEAMSPEVHKLFYGKTPQQEQIDLQKSDLEQKKFDWGVERDQLTQLRNERRDLQTDRRLDAADAAGIQRAKEFDAKIALSERTVAAHEQSVQIQMKRLELAMANSPEEKRLKGLDYADYLVNQMDMLAPRLAEKGYIPPPGSAKLSLANIKAQTLRSQFPNDPDWQTWTKEIGPSLVGYARNVEGDLGPRAIQAFAPVLGLGENPPDAASIKAITDRMRGAIKLSREGKDVAQNIVVRDAKTGMDQIVPWKRGWRLAPGDQIMGIE